MSANANANANASVLTGDFLLADGAETSAQGLAIIAIEAPPPGSQAEIESAEISGRGRDPAVMARFILVFPETDLGNPAGAQHRPTF